MPVRKLILCVLCMLLVVETASAGGLAGLMGGAAPAELPDPEMLLTGGAVLYEAGFSLDGGESGTAYVYPMPDVWDAFLMEYTALCEDAGYMIEKGTQRGQPAWRITSGGNSAWLIPAYRGGLLLVAQRGIPFAPIPTPVPTATPRPTAAPEWQPSGGAPASSGGHVEYVSVQQDCFACIGGVCSMCKGTGVYRMYGVEVDCSPVCQTCDGLGWWTTTSPVWVSD